MSYEAGTTTSVADLFQTKLRTFALANGWTDSEGTSAAGRQYLHKGTIYVSFRWDTGTPANVGMYHALGYINAGTAPGNHTDDSGQGIVTGTNATFVTGRFIPLDNDSNAYWFFEEDDYIHVVVETSTGTYAHFGFGAIAKLGTWTGGEYAYANRVQAVGSPVGLANSYFLDGLARGTSPAVVAFLASLHCAGLPGQGGTGRWALVWGGGTANLVNDRAGVARVYFQGGYRSGPVGYPFGKWSGTALQGLVPLTPIHLFYLSASVATSIYPMGYMKDTRAVNIAAFVGAQEITIGGDTWVVFPAVNKTTSASNQGVAYKKIT